MSFETVEDVQFLILKIALVELAEKTGFKGGVKADAAETLTDLVGTYIQKIGKRASDVTAAAGRTETNYFDVENALRQVDTGLEQLQEFDEKLQLPISKNALISLIEYPTPSVTTIPNVVGMDEENGSKNAPKPSHVPSFLPAFPPEYTHKNSPAKNQVSEDASQINKTRRMERKALQQQIVGIGN